CSLTKAPVDEKSRCLAPARSEPDRSRRERSERLARPAEVPAAPAPPPRAPCAARRSGAARDSEPLRSGGSWGKTGGSPPCQARGGEPEVLTRAPEHVKRLPLIRDD